MWCTAWGWLTAVPRRGQIVNHGHFLVNGVRVDIPSAVLRPGDVIRVRDGSRNDPFFKEMPDLSEQRTCAVWLDRDLAELTGRVAPHAGTL